MIPVSDINTGPIGTLYFQHCSTSFADAVSDVCEGGFSHVGMLVDDGWLPLVIEAYPPLGVIITPLDDFINSAETTVVGEFIAPFVELSKRAARISLRFLGRDYNKAFDIKSDKMYCSQLIYQCFLEANNGKPFFKLKPMNFFNGSRLLPEWHNYFIDLKVAVPQNRPGISPTSIYKSQMLKKSIYMHGKPGISLVPRFENKRFFPPVP